LVDFLFDLRDNSASITLRSSNTTHSSISGSSGYGYRGRLKIYVNEFTYKINPMDLTNFLFDLRDNSASITLRWLFLCSSMRLDLVDFLFDLRDNSASITARWLFLCSSMRLDLVDFLFDLRDNSASITLRWLFLCSSMSGSAGYGGALKSYVNEITDRSQLC
jgi:hypothetical protein